MSNGLATQPLLLNWKKTTQLELRRENHRPLSDSKHCNYARTCDVFATQQAHFPAHKLLCHTKSSSAVNAIEWKNRTTQEGRALPHPPPARPQHRTTEAARASTVRGPGIAHTLFWA